jgi:hypothetical protein
VDVLLYRDNPGVQSALVVVRVEALDELELRIGQELLLENVASRPFRFPKDVRGRLLARQLFHTAEPAVRGSMERRLRI